MKHRCQGCKALQTKDYGYECGLGYMISTEQGKEVKPLEECPKPKSFVHLETAKCKGDQQPLELHYCTLQPNRNKDCEQMRVVVQTIAYDQCCDFCMVRDCKERCSNGHSKCKMCRVKQV